MRRASPPLSPGSWGRGFSSFAARGRTSPAEPFLCGFWTGHASPERPVHFYSVGKLQAAVAVEAMDVNKPKGAFSCAISQHYSPLSGVLSYRRERQIASILGRYIYALPR